MFQRCYADGKYFHLQWEWHLKTCSDRQKLASVSLETDMLYSLTFWKLFPLSLLPAHFDS